MVRVYREGRSITEQAANIKTNGYKQSFPVTYTECTLDVYSDVCVWAF
jgi:outer membrane protease